MKELEALTDDGLLDVIVGIFGEVARRGGSGFAPEKAARVRKQIESAEARLVGFARLEHGRIGVEFYLVKPEGAGELLLSLTRPAPGDLGSHLLN